MPNRREIPDTMFTKAGTSIWRVMWSDVKVDDTVFLFSRYHGRSCGLGPFWIHDAEKRKIRNAQGNVFMHYAEELYQTFKPLPK